MCASMGGNEFSPDAEHAYLCWISYAGVPPRVDEIRYEARRILSRPLPEDIVLVPHTEANQVVLWAYQREPSPHVPTEIRHLDFPAASADEAQPPADPA